MPRPVRSRRRSAPRIGAVVTADHGMVDVPRVKHLLLSDGDGLTDDVRVFGGEPRMLHLYAEAGQRARRARGVARGRIPSLLGGLARRGDRGESLR